MNEARYAQIGEAFQRAADLETDARALYLEQLGERDPALAREVESLLAYDQNLSRADAFDEARLGWQPADLPLLDDLESGNSPTLPERIGPYFVTGLLGQGGMGRVYRCRQVAPIQREVAVKVIRAGNLTPQFLRRFQLECDALARMDHPGIARVFDAGTTEDGQPYFVMEYFPGEPLDQFCDRAQKQLRQRLQLFVRLTLAVHHAHQRGVLHRDLKPSNLLVAEVDGEVQVKVIDFGLARAVEAPGEHEEHATQPGQVLGTPAYMSPEQAGQPELIDVRTDIYALGVVLYELLTGSLPFESKATTALGALREIAARREAQRASHRFQRPTPENEDKARRRSIGVRQLSRNLRGELDWILHKALENQPSRRYPSALHFADDLRAYLSGEPVTAAPPGVFYLLGKFARRHRGLVAGLVLSFFSLTAGLAVALDKARTAERARGRADSLAYGMALALAEDALEERRVEDAEKVLLQVEESLRGWEWRMFAARLERDIWRAECAANLPHTNYGPSPPKVAFDLAGSKVATLLAEDSLGVWHVSSGEALWSQPTSDPVGATSFALGKDEALLGTMAGTVLRLSLEDGRQLGHWSESGAVRAVTYDGLGERAALAVDQGDGRGLVRIFDPQELGQGQPEAPLEFPVDAPIRDLFFANEGAWILVVTENSTGSLRSWAHSAEDGRRLGHLGFEPKGGGAALPEPCAAPLGKRVALGTQHQTIFLWNTGRELTEGGWFAPSQRLSDPTRTDVRGSALSLRGERLATASVDGALRIWEPETGELLQVHRLRGRSRLALSPKGRWCAAAGEGVLRVFDLDRADDVTVLRDDSPSLWYARLSPDGTTLATVPKNGFVRLWDLPTEALVGSLHPGVTQRDNMWQVATMQPAWDAEGTQLVTRRTVPPHVRIVRLDTATETRFELETSHSLQASLRAWIDTLGRVASLRQSVFHPSGDWSVNLVGTYLETTDQRREIAKVQGEEAAQETPANFNHAAAFSPDGGRFALARGDATIHEAKTGRLLATLEIPRNLKVYAVAWSPDGMRIATGTNDGRVSLWDGRTLAQIVEFQAHAGFVHDLQWSEDGELLVSVGSDGAAKLWDARTSAELHGQFLDVLQRREAAQLDVDQLVDESGSLTEAARRIRVDEALDLTDRRIRLGLLRESLHGQ